MISEILDIFKGLFMFLFALLKYSWSIELYWFWVYSKMIWLYVCVRHTHANIHKFFFRLFFHIAYYKILSIVLYGRSLLLIYFIYSSIYMLIHTQWKSSWYWERLRAKGEEGIRGWDGWMASPMQWTRTWTNFGRWWETVRPVSCSPWGHKESNTMGDDNNKCIC